MTDPQYPIDPVDIPQPPKSTGPGGNPPPTGPTSPPPDPANLPARVLVAA